MPHRMAPYCTLTMVLSTLHFVFKSSLNVPLHLLTLFLDYFSPCYEYEQSFYIDKKDKEKKSVSYQSS